MADVAAAAPVQAGEEIANGMPAEAPIANGASEAQSSAAAAGAKMSADEARAGVKKLIEFYFSDSNLPFDKFFFTLSHKDPEGWVPLGIITTFKRMRPFMSVLSIADVAEVMRSSEDLAVSSEGDKIRRIKPLVPQKDAYERSVYVKGFPEETPTLQQELETFFDQHGKINSVRMRRDLHSKPQRNAFKGSVFVEFADPDEMNAFLEKGAESVAEAERLKYNDTVLKIMSKDAYCQMKMAEKGIDPNSAQRGSHSGGASGKAGKRFNAFRELDREAKGLPSALSEDPSADKDSRQKRQRDDAERREAAEKRVADAKRNRSQPLEFDFMNKTLSTREDGTVDPETLEFPASSVVTFKGAGAGGNWRDLKETLSTIFPTSFVEFPDGAVEGAVGFRSTLEDDKLDEIVKKGIIVGGQPVVWTRPDEERAKQFYLDRANFRAGILINQREEMEASGGVARRGGGSGFGGAGGRGGRGGRGGHRGNRGGRGRGGRGGHKFGGGRDDGKRKRDYDASEDGPPQIMDSKKAKTADA